MTASSSPMALQARTRVGYQVERITMAVEQMVLGLSPRLASSNVTPFALIFQARTGSNMVRTALDGHRNIRCYREIFRNRKHAADGAGALGVPKRALPILLDNPGSFLDDYLFGPQPRGIHAVGFKLAYGHAREDEWLDVWQYLSKNNVNIIELHRRDSLAVLCSTERARSTGNFVKHQGSKKVAHDPIHISIERCEEFFTATARRKHEADQLFSENPRLSVDYEDLLSDWHGQTNRIQDFLEVPRHALAPSTARQSQLPTSESIANLYELREHFATTAFAQFFALDSQELT